MFNKLDLDERSCSRSVSALKTDTRKKEKFLNSALKSAKIFYPVLAKQVCGATPASVILNF